MFAKQGANQFVWNMRYPGAELLDNAVFQGSSAGPLAPPGMYAVELNVDGETLQQAFEIKKDSGTEYSNAVIEEQFDFHGIVLGDAQLGKHWEGEVNRSKVTAAARFHRLYLDNSVFLGTLNLDSIAVTGRVANLPMIAVAGDLDMRNAVLEGIAELRYAWVGGDVSLRGAELRDVGYFGHVHFGGLDLRRVEAHNNPLFFDSAHFEGPVVVESAELVRGATFENALFEEDFTMRHCRIYDRLNLSRARVLGTLVTIIAYTAIVSYQFRAGGMVLNLITGISIEQGIIITAIFVIGYTVLAGLISVAYTDVVNGVIMTIGLFIALPFLLSNAGGWDQVVNNLPDTHFSVLGDMTVIQALGYSLPTMLLLLGESGMYQRFFSARDERTAKRSVVGWLVGTIIIETLIIFLAIIGASIFTDIGSETVILVSVKNALPVLIGCVCLAAIVAVIVSTADSFLLVPATNIMRDIYQRFINPELPQKKMILYSRIVVVLLGLVAFVQVRFFEKILEMAIYAYTMYGVGITPAVMAAFFWKRATAAGGVSSIGAGMVVTIVWEVMGQPYDIPTVYPALALSLFCLIFISFMSPAPDRSKWQPFFE